TYPPYAKYRSPHAPPKYVSRHNDKHLAPETAKLARYKLAHPQTNPKPPPNSCPDTNPYHPHARQSYPRYAPKSAQHAAPSHQSNPNNPQPLPEQPQTPPHHNPPHPSC